ncbi:alpha/beta hydrolase [Ancylobacter mangrovi]|uniref:alpha/beta hydrolase n=1 Tax=Ancylobacter mangrovi TaxID=2972472 RepID=UPI002162A099|nr:alpha/beta hydrolase [Ancylobacter mangrovi]MCS0502204.1 alpha/beta hydrolase [Ancylobacter mangrovi]
MPARPDVVFVTFESMMPVRDPDRPGFAEHFLQSRGYSAYHMQPKTNSWYQYQEMAEALAMVREAIAPGTRLVTYGSSMGGYGAYRFSAPLRADKVIAFSPQYSINRFRTWWERRWAADGRPLIWDRQAPHHGGDLFIFYDPLNTDRHHIRGMRREADIRPVRMFFSGHASIAYVQELGFLEKAVLDIAEDRFDAAAFEALLWERRLGSSTYQRMRRRKRTGVLRRLKYALIEARLERHFSGTPALPLPAKDAPVAG